MNIHEYQSKELFRKFGVPVPKGAPAATVDEAVAVGEKMLAEGAPLVVVKSQIHAGGRGKGVFEHGFQGGVQLCRTADDVRRNASQMLGRRLVTRQTGPEGRVVRKLLVEGGAKILKEFYLAVLLDRRLSRPVVMASVEGGMDIEEVAERSPEKILRVGVDPSMGLQAFQARNLAVRLGLKGDLIGQAAKLMMGVYRTFWECDATQVEINPLILMEGADGKSSLMALDAKINVDDNALFRHPEIVAMRDENEESPLEVEASRFHLNYIKLNGNIACMVNGAGLAMSTMDIIQHFGGRPANFLDVAGAATKEQVTAAFRIVLGDAKVKGL